MKGGRKDIFYFSLLEYYPDSERWFLKSIFQVKDEDNRSGDEAIKSWIKDFTPQRLVVNIPLSSPECKRCSLDCPGENKCEASRVVEVRSRIDEILQRDEDLINNHSKTYERKRVNNDKDLISKSYKRRLKKGFLPYWNRPLDFWIWDSFYDKLLSIFNVSYDSFGNTSLMLMSRFTYLKRSLPKDLILNESNHYLALIELYDQGFINKKDITNLSNIDSCIDARLNILKAIEDIFNVFIYDHDLEILLKKSYAFESFILAICGQNHYLGRSKELPNWTEPEETRFIAPIF